jgi:hypothetical protein
MTTGAAIAEGRGRLIASQQDRPLFEYVFEAALPRELAPRPYFHPVHSLAGVRLTDHQPGDHLWQLGLAYSWPVVDQWNFWGGPTFVRNRGYVDLDNHGEIRHPRWAEGHERLEWLEWLDRHGDRIALERRLIGDPEIDRDAAAWWLDLETDIENTGEQELRIGSPTTEGRPLAGYAGLAWRGTEELRNARVVFDDGQSSEEAMGHRSNWLGYVGAGVTLAFFEHPANRGVPNRWFVRTEEYPLVASSPVFDTELRLAPFEHLRLRHRLLFVDGEWEPERLAEAAASAWVPRTD